MHLHKGRVGEGLFLSFQENKNIQHRNLKTSGHVRNLKKPKSTREKCHQSSKMSKIGLMVQHIFSRIKFHKSPKIVFAAFYKHTRQIVFLWWKFNQKSKLVLLLEDGSLPIYTQEFLLKENSKSVSCNKVTWYGTEKKAKLRDYSSITNLKILCFLTI